jgi:ribonuclease HI
MAEWRQITTNPSVLQLIERGLELEFNGPSPLRRHSPDFHGTPEQQAHLADQLQRWLADGVIEPSMGDELLTSLLFAVPKQGPKRWRWVLDCRRLNEPLLFNRFKMESVSSVRTVLRRADWLTSIDLEDAYLHVPLTRRAARHLAFRALGRVYRFRAMIFGLASAPSVFTMLMKPVMRHLHLQGVRAIAYLDDILIAARSWDEAVRSTLLTVQTLQRLGFSINSQKSELTPTQSLTYLGLEWNTARWTVQPPLEKLRQIGQDARRALRDAATGSLTARRMAGLAGKLVWAANGFAALHFRRRSLHRSVNFAMQTALDPDDWSTRVSLSRTTRRDLNWLASPALFECHPLPIRFAALDRAPTLRTDASLTGWGAVLYVPQRAPLLPRRLTAFGHWSPDELSRNESINTLEARAVARAFDAFSSEIRGLSHLHIESDNTTVVSYLTRWGGRLRHLAQELERPQRALLRWRVHLTVRHRPGSQNQEADQLSRRTATSRHDWTLSHSALWSIVERWGVPTVDWFATPLNHQVAAFASRSHSPLAIATDAFSVPWHSTALGLLVPPFPMISRVVAKALDDAASAVVVVPHWPTQSWWPLLMEAASDFLILGPTALVPATPHSHPMRDGRSPSLVAFRLV